MRRNLSRLLKPRSIAVIGGGAWCVAVLQAARQIGFRGQIHPVHPSGKDIAGMTSLKRIEDVPGPIDAAFIGINRHATVEAVDTLRRLGAGGAVCFASGFTEAASEDGQAANLQARLIEAAGEMPVLGPNCYGFVNALDGVAIWPDQHGMARVERGVAILTQSSNIAINLTMQRRALPIAVMVACGNMAQTGQAEIAEALLDDDRVSAIGLHVEGFGRLRDWESLARKAHERGIPLVVLKAGRSRQARAAAISHTASLAGSDAGGQAFLDRLGIARVDSLPALLETLKLLHVVGPLRSNRIASISCSGGEASLIADMAAARGIEFPPLSQTQRAKLREALGPMVALANPLDYHTYIWRNEDAMTRTWAAMTGEAVGLTLSIVDYPHTDASDWTCATSAALNARRLTGAPFAVVSSLPELMPVDMAERLVAGGVVPMNGLDEALAAVEAAARIGAPDPEPVLLAGAVQPGQVLTEDEAKSALARHDLPVPDFRVARSAAEAGRLASELHAPLALKGIGRTHKTEAGAVRLGLGPEEVEGAARAMGGDRFLIEEMVPDAVAELLIGVVRDPAHGFVLTLGAGGVLTEILRDTVSLLVPASRDAVRAALLRLRCARLLKGWRGRPAADAEAICDAVEAVQAYVIANAENLSEVEINPLICTPTGAVAVDALIRKARP